MRSTVLRVKGCKWQVLLGCKTLGIAVQCGHGQGKVQQMQSQCRQQTETADAVQTADTNFLSAPSLA